MLEQEVSLLKEVYHENIIELFAVYETNNALFMIFDYCEQELGTYVFLFKTISPNFMITAINSTDQVSIRIVPRTLIFETRVKTKAISSCPSVSLFEKA